jgi:hypothetical protein
MRRRGCGGWLPVRLRVEVRDRLVTMSVQRDGKWETLFTDADPVEPRLFLGLYMGSGDRNAAGLGEAVFENITWSQQWKIKSSVYWSQLVCSARP